MSPEEAKEMSRFSKWIFIFKHKILRLYSRLLIDPNNRKLKYFHLLVGVMLVYDFLLSGFILSNYNFHMNQDTSDFLNHRSNYLFICGV